MRFNSFCLLTFGEFFFELLICSPRYLSGCNPNSIMRSLHVLIFSIFNNSHSLTFKVSAMFDFDDMTLSTSTYNALTKSYKKQCFKKSVFTLSYANEKKMSAICKCIRRYTFIKSSFNLSLTFTIIACPQPQEKQPDCITCPSRVVVFPPQHF